MGAEHTQLPSPCAAAVALIRLSLGCVHHPLHPSVYILGSSRSSIATNRNCMASHCASGWLFGPQGCGVFCALGSTDSFGAATAAASQQQPVSAGKGPSATAAVDTTPCVRSCAPRGHSGIQRATDRLAGVQASCIEVLYLLWRGSDGHCCIHLSCQDSAAGLWLHNRQQVCLWSAHCGYCIAYNRQLQKLAPISVGCAS